MLKNIINNLNNIYTSVKSLKLDFQKVAEEKGVVIPDGEKLTNYPDYFKAKEEGWKRPQAYEEFFNKVANDEVTINGRTRKVLSYDDEDGVEYGWSSLGVIFLDIDTVTTFTGGKTYDAVLTSDGDFYDLSDGSTVIHTWKNSGTRTPCRWVIFYYMGLFSNTMTRNYLTPSEVPRMNGYGVYYVFNICLEPVGGYYSKYDTFRYIYMPYLQAIEFTEHCFLTNGYDKNTNSSYIFSGCTAQAIVLHREGALGIHPMYLQQCENLQYATLSDLQYVSADIGNQHITNCHFIDLDKIHWEQYTGDKQLNVSIYWQIVKGVMDLSISPLTIDTLELFTTSSMNCPSLKIKLPAINVKCFTYYYSTGGFKDEDYVFMAENAPYVEGKTLTTHPILIARMKNIQVLTSEGLTVYDTFIKKGWTIVST